jgi:hypothetical protein
MRRYCLALLALTSTGFAATYQVGPAHPPNTTLSALFNNVNLGPGDIVEVQGGVIYDVTAPGIVMNGVTGEGDDLGAPGNPIILRGMPVGGARPHLRGGTNTIEFRSSNHVVFENFEVSGTGNTSTGTFRCIFHHAHDITIRNVIVRDCPRHGILGADTDSGSLTVEYSEIRNSGSNGGNHAIYMTTDQITYPGSVFRLQYSYLHDSRFGDSGEGGNLIKSRSERNQIYYNWLEGAYYHELELIGPDPCGGCQQPGWTNATAREDSDVVGNMIVHTADFSSVLRLGGDATGASYGRYRLVNNTIVRLGGAEAESTIFRLFDDILSVEMHNNVIWRDTGNVRLVREVEAIWVAGSQVSGSNNWYKSGATFIPGAWTSSLNGTAPGFSNAGAFDFSLTAISAALDNAGAATPTFGSDYHLPALLFPPVFLPPQRALIPVGTIAPRPINGILDRGAYERPNDDIGFANGFE